MLAWASDQFDKISQTVAPPPTDVAGRFTYAVQRLDENTAMGCIAEIDPVRTVVNQSRGWFPIHMACQFSMVRLIRLLLNQPGANVQQPDYSGCTPLHHACMSTQKSCGLDVVKLMLNEYGADPCARNSQGQTPYDIASLDSIRQYLLPIQLQRETQAALDNGGIGLPQGIDLGGMKINRSNMAPPPKLGSSGVVPLRGENSQPTGTGIMQGAQSRYPATPSYTAMPTFGSLIAPSPSVVPAAAAATPSTSMAPAATIRSTNYTPPYPNPVSTFTSPNPNPISNFTPPSHGQQSAPSPHSIAPAPASMPVQTNRRPSKSTLSTETTESSRYSRTGGSSLAVYSRYKADGFHSSSSDKALQQKYGHVSTSGRSATSPPPSSGNNPVTRPSGPNPFSSAGSQSSSSYARCGGIPAPTPVSGPLFTGASIDYEPATSAQSVQYFAAGATVAPSRMAAPATAADSIGESNNGNALLNLTSPPYSAMSVPRDQSSSLFATNHTPTSQNASNLFVKPQNKVTKMSSKASFYVTVREPFTDLNPEDKEKKDPTNHNLNNSNFDWVETVDPTSGKTYYFNSKTNETSWEKPIEINSEKASAETVKQDAEDWVKTPDPSSRSKFYYCNTKTGEARWEKPALISATSRISSLQINEQENQPDVKRSESSITTDGHDEWVETVDPSSGKEYFYNTKTGETRWERQHENETPNTIATFNSNGNVSDKQSEIVLVETKQVENLANENSATTDDKEEENVTPANNVSDSTVTSEYCQTSIQCASTNKNEQDTKTDNHEQAKESNGKQSDIKNPENVPYVQGIVKKPKQLAMDDKEWTEVRDSSTGNVYYYNAKTQETTWMKPDSVDKKPRSVENIVADKLSESDEMTFDKTSSKTSLNKGGNVEKTEPAVDDNNWTEVKDPPNGNVYYYNVKTQETSWTKPELFDAKVKSIENAVVDLSNDDRDEPGVWIEVEDPSTGRTYYYKKETNETSWQKPSTMCHKPSSEDAISNKITYWVETFDPTSGKSYYYNSKTRMTSWEKPDCMQEETFLQHEEAPVATATKPIVDSAPRSAGEIFASSPSNEQHNGVTEVEATEFSNVDGYALPTVVDTEQEAKPAGSDVEVSTIEGNNSGDTNESNETDHDTMMDIPLSPDPVLLQKIEKNNSSMAQDLPNAPKVACAPKPTASGVDLFAAIGMPPPPLRSKR